MGKRDLERLSITLEFVSFFIAAPDFLGETVLAAISDTFGKLFRDFTKRLDDSAASWFGNIPLPFGRLGVIALAIILDIIIYFEFQEVLHPSPSTDGIPHQQEAPIVVIPFIVTGLAIIYLLQFLLEGATWVLRHQGAKRTFIHCRRGDIRRLKGYSRLCNHSRVIHKGIPGAMTRITSCAHVTYRVSAWVLADFGDL